MTNLRVPPRRSPGDAQESGLVSPSGRSTEDLLQHGKHPELGRSSLQACEHHGARASALVQGNGFLYEGVVVLFCADRDTTRWRCSALTSP